MTNAAGDSVYVDLNGQLVSVTGVDPGEWDWANQQTSTGDPDTLSITSGGLYTLTTAMREDGLRLDRLLLTTDTNFIPTDFGPPETERQLGGGSFITPLTRTIVYTYDNLYRLTEADYTSGETYQYNYDPVGNRLQQVIDGDTTSYTYDMANRIASVGGQSYTFDSNGNLLNTGVLTNVFDAANRLVSTTRDNTTLQPTYNGVGDRVGQITDGVTTTLALDVVGLPEVIYTSEGEVYLHLPGIIVTEKAGEVRYLLSDGLGSVRQVVDETAEVVAYNEFDPYGNPVENGSEPYGFSGEWWEDDVQLLHLRARWYLPQDGVFLSRDLIESEPPYQYVRGNPTTLVDPSGYAPNCKSRKCKVELLSLRVQAGGGILGFSGHLSIVFTNYNEDIYTVEGMPENDPFSGDPGSLIMFGPFEDQNDPVVTLPGQYRETGANGAKFIVLAEGETACGQWDCLKGKMQLIQSLDVPYRPWGPNSNTAVYSAVKACGLPTSGSQYDVGMWRTHLGWGIDLLATGPIPIPAPTPPGTPATPTSPSPPISPPRPSPSATPTRAGT